MDETIDETIDETTEPTLGRYRVEQTDAGCPECGHGAYWSIVRPDGVAFARDFADKEEAEDLAEMLNDARLGGRAAERERCAEAALSAQLPTHYIWGRDAMGQFEFGKKRAAGAIRALR